MSVPPEARSRADTRLTLRAAHAAFRRWIRGVVGVDSSQDLLDLSLAGAVHSRRHLDRQLFFIAW